MLGMSGMRPRAQVAPVLWQAFASWRAKLPQYGDSIVLDEFRVCSGFDKFRGGRTGCKGISLRLPSASPRTQSNSTPSTKAPGLNPAGVAVCGPCTEAELVS